MGGGGAAVAATVLTSAESAEALRRLAALGILTAPGLVKHLSGSVGGGQAPPKPVQASSKAGPQGAGSSKVPVKKLPPGPSPKTPTAAPKQGSEPLPEGTHKAGGTLKPRLATRSDPELLAENLTKDVGPRPPGHSAHHLVPKGMREAAEARDILLDADIGINDAANGVWLAETEQIVNEATGEIHSKMHTPTYVRWVTKLLREGAHTGPDGVRRALATIREAVASAKAVR
jgi:hypothetical protein